MTCNNFTPCLSRRDLLVRSGYGLGAACLHLLGASDAVAKPAFPNFAPKAKRVIFLFQSGGPSHVDLFDPKPLLEERFGEDIPDSIFGGQRVTGMVAHQARFQVMPTKYKFARHGQSGTEVSELLPHTAKIVDDICLIRAAHTEAINHDPAITFFQTGSQLPGRPSMGSWVGYGLGSESTAWVARTKTSRRSSSCTRWPAKVRVARACWRASGARVSCRAGIKACSSAVTAIQCCT